MLGVLAALLLAVVLLHPWMDAEPERLAHMVFLYLGVIGPAGVAAGLYWLHIERQDEVRVSYRGIVIESPSGDEDISWADVGCVSVWEGPDGSVRRVRILCTDRRRIDLFPYLPLSAIRQGVDRFHPPTVLVETLRQRLPWAGPSAHVLLLAAAAAALSLLLWLGTSA